MGESINSNADHDPNNLGEITEVTEPKPEAVVPTTALHMGDIGLRGVQAVTGDYKSKGGLWRHTVDL